MGQFPTLTNAAMVEMFAALREAYVARDVLIDRLLDENVELRVQCRRYEDLIMKGELRELK